MFPFLAYTTWMQKSFYWHVTAPRAVGVCFPHPPSGSLVYDCMGSCRDERSDWRMFMSFCLRPLSRSPTPASHYSNFHFILMPTHSQPPSIILCVKMEDACMSVLCQSLAYPLQTSKCWTALQFNMIWLWGVILTFCYKNCFWLALVRTGPVFISSLCYTSWARSIVASLCMLWSVSLRCPQTVLTVRKMHLNGILNRFSVYLV